MGTIRLEALAPDDLREPADAIRELGRTAESVEQAAQDAAQLLYGTLVTEDGAPACALVRIYKTHPYGQLEPGLQEFARSLLDGEPSDELRCLTLLGTAGTQPEWNSRHESVAHKAIPLPSAEFVGRLPMVAQLISQLGLDVGVVVQPPQEAVSLSQQTYDVFHVEEALGSPQLPAQDFIAEHGVRSAVGFGGILLTGDFYAAVLFSKVPVSMHVARTLKIFALPLRIALWPVVGRPVFVPE